MRNTRVNAARFIGRVLPDPYEIALGGHHSDATHHLLATVFADLVCPPTGHRTPWHDCYDTAWARPLPHKASFILNEGRPRPVPASSRAPQPGASSRQHGLRCGFSRQPARCRWATRADETSWQLTESGRPRAFPPLGRPRSRTAFRESADQRCPAW
ncbi:hypothetical protein Sfulv_61580 [Streptomyces fulvorobeus]|uniref:Uncharacterized protein n=1 Tax=Streptomyces fulvorobeus TaxID=284028 RepID=A0A7J0CGE8_9ACTN|nr:hypothetical protein Sfulv_61580 [Streptomyces fulvorobeus]